MQECRGGEAENYYCFFVHACVASMIVETLAESRQLNI